MPTPGARRRGIGVAVTGQLVEDARSRGAEVVFLNHPIGGTAEDDLLLQIQGVIAEYERAKILERSRRGRRASEVYGCALRQAGRKPYVYISDAPRDSRGRCSSRYKRRSRPAG